MLSYGNGSAAKCVNNLVRISRGEVPYDRIKGVKLSQRIGKTIAAREEIADDAKWMVGVYEPRVNVESVKISVTDGVNGHANMTVNVRGESSDG